MKRNRIILILTVTFFVTQEFILSTNGNYLLVKLQEENIDLKTKDPEEIDYLTTKKPQANVTINPDTTCTLENQCVRVHDPDKKLSMKDDLFSPRPNMLLGYKCCYRYWYNGYYYCNWGEYWCKYWWGK